MTEDKKLKDREAAQEILETVSDSYYVLDDEWRLKRFNDAAEKALGKSADEAVGQTLWEVCPEPSDEFERRLRDAAESDEPVEFEYHHDPTERWFRVCTCPSGTGVSVHVRDITERVEAKRELERTKEELVLVNRILRHDIRNDMNVVLGWGEELRDHVDDEGAEILERILRTTNHTVDLTTTARNFVEAVTEEGTGQLEKVSLAEAVRDEVERCRGMYGEDTFTVGEIPDVEVRANSLLSSALSNILDNAVEHSNKDEDEMRIEVTAEEDGETVRVRIADNGPGILPENREAVFGRGDEGLDDSAAGLGLHLVDTVVRGYGGDVWIEDNDSGGAVFVIEIPRADRGGDSDV